jgi:hypothetical protein
MSRSLSARSFLPVACGALAAIAAAWIVAVRDRDETVSTIGTQATQTPAGAYSTRDPGADFDAQSGIVTRADASAAIDAALALGDAAERETALHEALTEFLSEHPLTARKWLRETIPGLASDTRIAVLRELAALDPRLAMELANQVRGADQEEAIREVQIAWASTDPIGSSRAFLSGSGARDTNPASDDGGAAELSRVWANEDPASAFAFAAALPSSGARHEALAAVVESWALSDPAASARAVARLPQSDSRMPLVDRVAAGWASSDPDAALAWARALPLAQERVAATTTVLGVTAKP